MREDFLHYLWRQRRFNLNDLQTSEKIPLEILHPGEHNTHAGPDFLNARIRLDQTLWAGNVELHLKASEWLAHGHSADPAYDNVVLHVVFEEDLQIRRSNGELLPCLILRHRIPPRLIEAYYRLSHEQNWIPCQASIGSAPEIVWNSWLERLLIERLEWHTTAFESLLQETNRHWEEAFYRRLAWNFGLKVNAEPFLMLARSLPFNMVSRYRNSLFQLEALLFGQAGLLPDDPTEAYPQQLRKEYGFMQHKYGLSPLTAGQWKFLRLRPANFPTVRLAQFAALIHRSVHLFSEMLEAPDVPFLENHFAAPLSIYWQDHYQFEKPTVVRNKTAGRELAHSVVINTVAPVLFLYGKEHARSDWQKKALDWLETMPAESNALLNGWSALGIKAHNAYRSQALLHLKKWYCDPKRCLECAVGHAILRE